MITTLLALVVLAGFGLYVMTREERERMVDGIAARVARVVQPVKASLAHTEFDAFLRARTPYAMVTPFLIALNIVLFVLIVLSDDGDAQTLIGWGANFAPRTTNGEWWRLVSAMFVHGGAVHVMVAMAGLISVGFMLERAVGPLAFAAVYIASGAFAGVVALWTAPALAVNLGAAGAVFGLYGLLAASLIWGVIGRAPVRMPLTTVKRVGVVAIVFLAYNVIAGHLTGTSAFAGFTAGLVSGLIVARGITRQRAPVGRAAFVTAAATLIAVVTAVPVRGIIDVRSEIASVIALEERTAGLYDAAAARFRNGSIPTQSLVTLIDGSILPEVQATRARVQALRGVPIEHRRVVGAAEEYLQLREASWRDRGTALRESDPALLREADRAEQAALGAFRRMKAS